MTNQRRTASDAPDVEFDLSNVDDVWATCGPPALRFATVLVGPDDAHDVMSNAFLRVSRRSGWTDIDQPRSYWFRAIQSEAQNHHRKRKRRWQRDLVGVHPSATFDRQRDVDLVEQLAKLSIQQRSIVYLRYWEDMTESAIADSFGLSTGTVHRTLTRARNQLRKALS